MITTTNAVITVGGGSTPPETPTDALLFYSPNEIGLSIANATKNWNGALYYSTDHTNWTEWNGTTQIISALSDGYHKIYLRGINNTRITGGGSKNFVVYGALIVCVGNIMNLLDYTRGISMADQCFSHLFENCYNVYFNVSLPTKTLSISCYEYMFSNCTSLITPPELPATTLANYCYRSMFYGCVSLAVPPKLPAITLANYCYNAMFNLCKSLTSIPELPATTLVNNCYNIMFNNCAKIKLSTEQTGEYQTEYRIPISGTGTDATSALSGMFSSTGGAFAGTPTINTIYYTSNTIIPAT